MHLQGLAEGGGTTGRAKTTLVPFNPWAARHNTLLLIKLTPKGVVFSFVFFLAEADVGGGMWVAVCAGGREARWFMSRFQADSVVSSQGSEDLGSRVC